jgi:hypothetical protein
LSRPPLRIEEVASWLLRQPLFNEQWRMNNEEWRLNLWRMLYKAQQTLTLPSHLTPGRRAHDQTCLPAGRPTPTSPKSICIPGVSLPKKERRWQSLRVGGFSSVMIA